MQGDDARINLAGRDLRAGGTSRNRTYLILITLFLAWIVGSCEKTAISVAVLPISEEFGFNSVQIGLILSSFFTGYTILTVVGGILADRFGSRIVLTTIMILWSFFTGITGLAWSLGSFVAVRFLFGAAEGGFAPASSVTIAELFPKKSRGRAKAFLVSAAQIGTAVGIFTISAFIASVGWRYAFMTYAVFGILISVSFWVLFNVGKGASGAVLPTRPKLPLSHVFRLPLVWKLLVMQFAIGTFFFGLSSWLPSYWVTVKGMSLVSMGALTATVSLIAFACQNFSGWVLDKFLAGRERGLICGMLAIAGPAVFFMYMAESVAAGFFWQGVATVAIAVTSPVIFTLALKYLPDEFVGTGSGIANLGQQLAGMLSPALFGYLITAFGGSYSAVFLCVVGAVVVALGAALTVHENVLAVPAQA